MGLFGMLNPLYEYDSRHYLDVCIPRLNSISEEGV